MRRDLPGQAVMFPELEPLAAAAAEPRAARPDGPAAALTLPHKPTCTCAEAAACTGISERQIRYFVDDGTLLAINAARTPVGMRPPKGRPENALDRWRIVVRRGPEFAGEAYKTFLTLEEFLKSRMNQEA
jgi:hypothetical protein